MLKSFGYCFYGTTPIDGRNYTTTKQIRKIRNKIQVEIVLFLLRVYLVCFTGALDYDTVSISSSKRERPTPFI